MRVHLKIKTTNEAIPFDHQPLLTGTVHKWLGWNNEHGEISLYSFSQLEGGKATPKGLRFERGTSFYFSSYNPDLIKKLIGGIQGDPTLFHGLTVFEVDSPKAGTKKINYNGVHNRCSWCPVIIQGKPETKLFAWNVGLGNSTGIGFGAIK